MKHLMIFVAIHMGDKMIATSRKVYTLFMRRVAQHDLTNAGGMKAVIPLMAITRPEHSTCVPSERFSWSCIAKKILFWHSPGSMACRF